MNEKWDVFWEKSVCPHLQSELKATSSRVWLGFEWSIAAEISSEVQARPGAGIFNYFCYDSQTWRYGL